MPASKADIIAQLEKEILPLQGFKAVTGKMPVQVALGPINEAFPNAVFPVGAVHELVCSGMNDLAATSGFMTGICSSLMQKGGVPVWISTSRTIFPPALQFFGIDPGRIIFVDCKKEKDVAWAMEEALACEGLAAVIAEMPNLDFKTSRRLQLVVEQSQVTGFVVHKSNRPPNTNACIARWKITSLPGVLEEHLPGIGFPCWKVELLKVRNGKPQSWEIAWMNKRFSVMNNAVPVLPALQKKTG